MNHARLAILAALVVTALAVAQEPCTLQRVVAPPTVGTDDFGSDVKTNGSQWFVGTPDARTLCAGPATSCSSGAVFVYDNVDGRLVHAQTIVPPDVGFADKFGISLDVEGDRLVVGSLFTRNPATGVRAGAVFEYEFDGQRWVEVDRIWPPPSITYEFAPELLLDGETLVMTTQRGKSAEVYKRNGVDGWHHLQTLTQPDLSGPSIGFGVHWAVRGDWFVTGGYQDRRVTAGGGAVFIYRRDAGGRLGLVQEILSDPEPMLLGISVGFAGDTLAVGAPAASPDEEFQGVVRFYEYDGERWVLDGELTQDEPREDRQFGFDLFAREDRLYVSAFNERSPFSHGMVYGYKRTTSGAWMQTDRFVPTSAHYAGNYGTAMASDGEYLLVGASRDESVTGEQVGAAYLFDLTCGDCRPDLDLDGTLTIFDFLTFLNLFQDGDAQADFDGDGELTIFDFLAFQTAFDAGCE